MTTLSCAWLKLIDETAAEECDATDDAINTLSRVHNSFTA